MGAPVLMVTATPGAHRILHVNPAFAERSGYAPEELHSREVGRLMQGPPVDGTWTMRASDGSELELVAAPLHDPPGRPSVLLLTTAGGLRGTGDALSAATALAGSGTGSWLKLPRDSRMDSVTGLPGRAAFAEVLARDWALARREARELSVVVFRIDDYDSYVSVFGRHAADACLKKVAHGISNSLRRATDYCARVGHDEFAVLIVGVDRRKAGEFAARIAQRVRDLAIHHPRSAVARYVTVSCGVASEVPPRDSADCPLLECAEAAVPGPDAVSAEAAAVQPPPGAALSG